MVLLWQLSSVADSSAMDRMVLFMNKEVLWCNDTKRFCDAETNECVHVWKARVKGAGCGFLVAVFGCGAHRAL